MRLLFTSFLLICYAAGNAQIDLQCNGRDKHSIYLLSEAKIYRVDSVDTMPTDPILVSPGSPSLNGISINKNLNNVSGNMTMYGIPLGGNYFYLDGSNWVNTNHSAGSNNAVNPGGSNSYIFNLDGLGNKIYRYNGTGDGTLLLSNLGTSTGAAYDVAVDRLGNFYVFYTNNNKILCFNPEGIPLDTFTTTGNPTGASAGFAILGERMYLVDGIRLYEGIKTDKNLDFTLIKTFTVSSTDIAACPDAGEALAVFKNPEAPHFAVYPIPARDNVIIKLNNTESIMITDILGEILIVKNVTGLSVYQVAVGGWTPGTYLITAVAKNGEQVVSKMVVN